MIIFSSGEKTKIRFYWTKKQEQMSDEWRNHSKLLEINPEKII